jgi:hypothetical protein
VITLTRRTARRISFLKVIDAVEDLLDVSNTHLFFVAPIRVYGRNMGARCCSTDVSLDPSGEPVPVTAARPSNR